MEIARPSCMASGFRRIRSSEFLGNVSRLLSGEMFVQALGLAMLPILTRLYGPEAFGVLGVFVAVSEILGRIASLRYDMAIVLPRDSQRAWALLRFSAVFAFVFCGVALALSFPFRHALSELLGAPSLAPFFPLLVLMILGSSWQSLGNFWLMRSKQFKVIAGSAMRASLVGNGFRLAIGFLGGGVIGLLGGNVIQRWAILFFNIVSTPRALWSTRTEKGQGWEAAKLYGEFPKYRMPQDTLNATTRQIPNIILAAFFGPVVVGFYLLAHRAIAMPITLVQNSVRKVFYVKAVEVGRKDQSLFALCVKMTGLIGLAMAPAAGGVFLLGDWLFQLIFGPEWGVAGQYAKWIMLAVSVAFCSVPASVVLPVVGWNKFYLGFEVFATVFRVSVIVFFASQYSSDATVIALSIAAVCTNLLLIGTVLLRLRFGNPRIVDVDD